MTHASKKNIATTLAGILVIVAYIIYATGVHAPDTNDIKAWAVAMLVFVGIGVGAAVAVQILFHVGMSVGMAVKGQGRDEKELEKEIEETVTSTFVEDEMYKLIQLKSSYVGYIVMGTGFCAALVALAAGVTAVTALHVLFGGAALASVAEGVAGIFFYEKGVYHA